VLNEAPSEDERARGAPGEDGAARDLATGVVLHTTLGDIHLKLYPRECPKTVENFLVTFILSVSIILLMMIMLSSII
jgi:peptidylprolyl isomerase domain and WD repeat-containing protein 1